MIDVNVGDHLLSLDVTGKEEWVRVGGKSVRVSTPVLAVSARYLDDVDTFELGGYAVSADGAGVLCSFPPPYVGQDTAENRADREAYVDDVSGRVFEISGAVVGGFCNEDGANRTLRQGFHVASCSETVQEWVDRVQRAITQELGAGFTVTQTSNIMYITNTETGVKVGFPGRKGKQSTFEFSGLYFYQRFTAPDGSVQPVKVCTLDLAKYFVYRGIEDGRYVPFTYKSPAELLAADEERQNAMRRDADCQFVGTVEWLGAGHNLLLGLPTGTRREPLQVNDDLDDDALELMALKYYLLGQWLGDGSVSANENDNNARLSIEVGPLENVHEIVAQANNDETCEDDDGVETDLCCVLNKLAPLKTAGYCQEYGITYDARPRQRCVVLRIRTPEFCDWLRDLEVITRKGNGDFEELAKEILTLPRRVRTSFLAGCIDSDGFKQKLMSTETLTFSQAVEGGVDQSRVPNASSGHSEILSLFAIVATSLPQMDVRYHLRRVQVGEAFKNVPGAPAFDPRRRNSGNAVIRSTDDVIPSAIPRKRNKLYPGRFIRIGSTFGRWSDPGRRTDCVDITVDSGSGHLLLANGTVIAVNRRADETSSDETSSD